ncbi:hypothetical protein I79_026022 [Cricetulus griseus]|uniref:Uncharacterized protein n=1 Tax=Cricetulus griseus TaxID=10029 RepID=G3IPU4_CRIGR|nr:hypothetical protein I79_026022 [Cricetulus griseus]
MLAQTLCWEKQKEEGVAINFTEDNSYTVQFTLCCACWHRGDASSLCTLRELLLEGN